MYIQEKVGLTETSSPGKRVLIFNQQGRPEANDLLTGLFTALQAQGLIKFDHVVFCTNVTYAENGYKKGTPFLSSIFISRETTNTILDFVNKTYDPDAIAHLTVQKGFASTWSALDPSATVSVTASIESALEYVKNLAKSEKEVQAFITGSLHLVGGALGLLEGKEVL
jgi:folylpolyglutamate synthase